MGRSKPQGGATAKGVTDQVQGAVLLQQRRQQLRDIVVAHVAVVWPGRCATTVVQIGGQQPEAVAERVAQCVPLRAGVARTVQQQDGLTFAALADVQLDTVNIKNWHGLRAPRAMLRPHDTKVMARFAVAQCHAGCGF